MKLVSGCLNTKAFASCKTKIRMRNGYNEQFTSYDIIQEVR